MLFLIIALFENNLDPTNTHVLNWKTFIHQIFSVQIKCWYLHLHIVVHIVYRHE